MNAKSPLIIAIDTPEIEHASLLLEETSPFLGAYKLGLEFFLANGIDGVGQLHQKFPNVPLFLDLKLHDIPNTVKGACLSIKKLSPYFLTVHASGGAAMVEAAAQVLPDTFITAVTVLTSLDSQELTNVGIHQEIPALTVSMAANAIKSGARALVCSPHEVSSIRAQVGEKVVLITPGVRPAGKGGTDDQKRIMTPSEALANGANFLVIGRPITASSDPAEAARKILNDIGW